MDTDLKRRLSRCRIVDLIRGWVLTTHKITVNKLTKPFLITLASAVISFTHTFRLVAAETNAPSQPAVKNSTPVLSPILIRFVAEKRALEETIAQKHELKVPPQVWDFFNAAAKGDWVTTSNLFYTLEAGIHSRSGDRWVPAPLAGAIFDAFGICELVESWNLEFLNRFGDELVKSIPPGSIYFGGTAVGRFVASAFSQSHSEGRPFFTLTQNALSDPSYLTYLEDIYGNKIFVPSTNDSQKYIEEYTADVRARLKHDQDLPFEPRQIRPGENTQIVDGSIQFNGQVSVMALHALIAKAIFDKNPNREFYIEESFPLDWMYPYLTPHQFIMKLNREPLREIPPSTVRTDREFWTRRLDSWFGAWLNTNTPVSEVTKFVERTYLNKELEGFSGNPRFIQDIEARNAFSKMRVSIAGLYVWRATNSKDPTERRRMVAEADFAFRQAFTISPTFLETIYRYVNLLAMDNRLSDAVLIVNAAHKLDPDNQQLEGLLKNLLSANQHR
jgi:hypothetical protein